MPRSYFLRLPAAVLTATLLAACTVGPDYRPPAVDVGQGWTQPADTAMPAELLVAWWRSLGDPALDRLVETALAGNLDLREAQARVAEARALRDFAAGGQWPAVQAAASVTRRRQSENGPLPIASIPDVSRDQTIYETGFDAVWEVDLFGPVRRAVEGGEARLAATEEMAQGMLLSVAAEVARTYLSMRGAQRELTARTAQVEALRKIAEITERRAAAGDLALADVERVRARLEALAATQPGIEARLRGAALGLGVLLGGLPEAEAALAETPAPEIVLAPVPVGERADLLRRRPDVRTAERLLAAATADAGAAQAEWFPKLTIGAGGGFQALDLGELFQASSLALAVAPTISWRIFDGGRVRAQIRAAEARQEAAALAYEQAVLVALTDAERALSQYRLGLEAVTGQRGALAAAQRSYRHAESRFEYGDIALFDLLDAERTLHEAEDLYVRAQTAAAIDLVALYKALGGGWGEER